VIFRESGVISIREGNSKSAFKKDEIKDFTKIFQAMKEYFSKHPGEFRLGKIRCKENLQEGGFW
jgi:hypothetical protein